MDVERVEIRAEVVRHVRETVTVEQGEDLVILAPEFAEPLHGQRLRCHDEAPFHSSRVDEAIEDEARLDRLAEAHFVREEPPHRIGSRRTFGHVQLMREQADASAEKRSQPVRLTRREKLQAFQTHEQIFAIRFTIRQPFQQRSLEWKRPQLVGAHHTAVGEPKPSVLEGVADRRLLARRRQSNRATAAQLDRDQRIRVVRKPKRRPRAWELDEQGAALDRDDAADAKLRIESMGEVVTCVPGGRWQMGLPMRRSRFVVQQRPVFDEVSELLLRRKRRIEERMRNDNAGRHFPAADHVATLLLRLCEARMKTE